MRELDKLTKGELLKLIEGLPDWYIFQVGEFDPLTKDDVFIHRRDSTIFLKADSYGMCDQCERRDCLDCDRIDPFDCDGLDCSIVDELKRKLRESESVVDKLRGILDGYE